MLFIWKDSTMRTHYGLFLYLKHCKCHPDQITLRPTISHSGIDECFLGGFASDILPGYTPQKLKINPGHFWIDTVRKLFPILNSFCVFQQYKQTPMRKNWTLMAGILCLLSHRNSRWFSAILGLCQNLELRDKRQARNHKHKALTLQSNHY